MRTTVSSQITTPLTPAQTATAELCASKEGYIHRVLVAFDIFSNVTLLDGDEDETISSHAERSAIKGEFLGKILSRGLDLLQHQHGQKAIAGDTERATTVVTVESTSGAINGGSQTK
jgi:hypothetical protein